MVARPTLLATGFQLYGLFVAVAALIVAAAIAVARWPDPRHEFMFDLVARHIPDDAAEERRDRIPSTRSA